MAIKVTHYDFNRLITRGGFVCKRRIRWFIYTCHSKAFQVDGKDFYVVVTVNIGAIDISASFHIDCSSILIMGRLSTMRFIPGILGRFLVGPLWVSCSSRTVQLFTLHSDERISAFSPENPSVLKKIRVVSPDKDSCVWPFIVPSLVGECTSSIFCFRDFTLVSG